jgi:O-methyltransferase involved in polyketide biosynthesis
MSMPLAAFTPAQESLFLTLGGRALDSRLPHPFLGDTLADGILAQLDYDLARFGVLTTKLVDARTKVFDIAVRAKRLDEIVGRFIDRHPDAVVLDLGAGLDTRAFRVDPPPTVDWFDVDFPTVVDLRDRVLPRRANTHSIGANVGSVGWLEDVPAARPALIVADGLIPFVSQDDLVSLLMRLVGHFPAGELAFNLYTTYAMWTVRHSRGLGGIGRDAINPGFNDPARPERWVDGLTLVEEIFLTRAHEVGQLPPWVRVMSRLAAPSATASRMIGTVLLRYSFGGR